MYHDSFFAVLETRDIALVHTLAEWVWGRGMNVHALSPHLQNNVCQLYVLVGDIPPQLAITLCSETGISKLFLASWLYYADRGTLISHYCLLNSIKQSQGKEQFNSVWGQSAETVYLGSKDYK